MIRFIDEYRNRFSVEFICQKHRPGASTEQFVHDRYQFRHGGEHATFSARRRRCNFQRERREYALQGQRREERGYLKM